MSMTMWDFSLSSLMSLSTWAWMVTSSAVVGSSAIRMSGSQARGNGDDHALLHAPRELVRVLRHASARDPHPLQHVCGLAQGFLLVHAAVDLDALGDLLAHGLDGV